MDHRGISHAGIKYPGGPSGNFAYGCNIPPADHRPVLNTITAMDKNTTINLVALLLLRHETIYCFQVGLAVDDIKGTLEKAVLKRLGLQVELALSIESLLPTSFRRRFIIGGQVIKYPNKPPSLWKQFYYQLWGHEGFVSSQPLVRGGRGNY